MIEIVVGAFILSIVHASIPNHWIPFVAIGKTEKWTRSQTLWITAIAGFAHTSGTILIGIFVGIIGYNLSSTYENITKFAIPLVLVLLGIIYLIWDLTGTHAHHDHVKVEKVTNKPRLMIVLSLILAMFFSPCIEIVAYYLPASALGWLSLIFVSIIYLIVTVSGMILLVYLSLHGVEKIKWHFLEHHEKLVSGCVLIFIGVLAYFIEI